MGYILAFLGGMIFGSVFTVFMIAAISANGGN